MLEIILKYLIPCQHIPILHRHKINKIDPYLNSVEYFLDLTPEVMKRSTNSIAHEQIQPVSKTIGANWNHYGLHQGESLYSNYHAYLFDARNKILQCKIACDQWNNLYKYQKMPNSNSKKVNQQNSEKIVEMIKNFMQEFSLNETNSIIYTNDNITNNNNIFNENEKSNKQFDSLQSLGESSGYESFKYRPDDDEEMENECHDIVKKETWKISNQKDDKLSDLDLSEDLFRQGTVSLGIFSL